MPRLPISQIRPGMILDRDVTARNGRFLLSKDTVIGPDHLRVLLTWGVEQAGIRLGDDLPPVQHDPAYPDDGAIPLQAAALEKTPLRTMSDKFRAGFSLTSLARGLPVAPSEATPQAELSHLRKIHAFTLHALQQAAALSDIHSGLSSRADSMTILDKTMHGIDGLIQFQAAAFFLMNESQAMLSLARCRPEAETARLDRYFESALCNGLVARSIWERQPLLATCPNGERFLLHLMHTASRVRGLFLGLLDPKDAHLPETVLSLLDNLLQSAASALESSELYAIFRRQNLELQSQVEARTAELKETVDRLEIEVSERREAQQGLARTLDNLALILDNVHDAIVIYRPDGRVLELNENMLRMFSVTREQALNLRIPNDISCPRRSGDVSLAEWKDVLGKGSVIFEWSVRRNGEDTAFPVEVFLRKIIWNGETAVLATLRDITARKETERQLEFLALHDPLTELPNRKLFLDRMSHAMSKALRDNTLVAVLFLDLNAFKPVNDIHGHDAGDAVLKVIAARLSAALRKSDTVARIGGDEFGAVIADMTTRKGHEAVVNKLHAAVRKPMNVKGHQVELDCSVGVALFPEDGRDVDTLLKLADERMYVDKKAGNRGR